MSKPTTTFSEGRYEKPNISGDVLERMADTYVDTSKMSEDAVSKPTIRARQTQPNPEETLDYVIDQRDVDAMNKLSRKVGAITSSGDATSTQWKKCVNAQLAHDTCQDGYKIGSEISVNGCRISNGHDDDRGSVDFLVPDIIKAPMTQSGKEKYTAGYNRLKNILVNNDGPTPFTGQALRCEKYNLETRKGGRKRRGKKRGRKTRDKKRVKKTRTKKKHVKKTRGKKRGRKTRGRKMSKRRGTRKRSYRKRR